MILYALARILVQFFLMKLSLLSDLYINPKCAVRSNPASVEQVLSDQIALLTWVWLRWYHREWFFSCRAEDCSPEMYTDRRIHSCHSPVGNANCNEYEGDNWVEQCRHYIANSPMKERKRHVSYNKISKKKAFYQLLISSFLLWATCW